MIASHEMIATKADVQNFGTEGHNQLGNLVLGEREARLGMLVVIAAGTNGVFVGDPGGGKTSLAEHAHKLVNGIDNLSVIPPEADLKPRQIVGGRSSVRREVGGIEEIISTDTNNPILTEETQVIWADEINRGAPHAINALLGSLASRKFANTAGVVDMSRMEYAVSTMNPGGLNEGVFKINPANASRHSMGVVMGLEDKEHDVDDIIDKLLLDWRSAPEKITPVTDLHTLHAIRNYIYGGQVAFSESLRRDTKTKIKTMHSVLREHGVREAYPRMTIHIAQNAKAVAALRGEDAVDTESVNQAIKFVVGARVGMRKPDAEREIPEVIAKILN